MVIYPMEKLSSFNNWDQILEKQDNIHTNIVYL